MEGFSTRLRELRKERNLRQKDLAAVLGLAQTTIANYEQNTRFPDEETLKKIVDYFNTSLDFLLGLSGMPYRSIAGRDEAATWTVPTLLSPLAKAYLEALLAGDKARSQRLVLDECKNGTSIGELYAKVLQPALEEVGHRWEAADTDVYEEHFVSAATVNLMARLMEHARPLADRKGVFLSVVCGGEQHDIGLRMVSDLLEIAGWQAMYLGVNLPARSVIRAIEERRADILGISVTMRYNLNSAADLIDAVRSDRSSRNLRILVGGQAFRSERGMWRRIGADAQAHSAAEAVAAADGLLAGRVAN